MGVSADAVTGVGRARFQRHRRSRVGRLGGGDPFSLRGYDFTTGDRRLIFDPADKVIDDFSFSADCSKLALILNVPGDDAFAIFLAFFLPCGLSSR